MLGGCGSVQEPVWAPRACGDAADCIELADDEPSRHQMQVELVGVVLKTTMTKN